MGLVLSCKRKNPDGTEKTENIFDVLIEQQNKALSLVKNGINETSAKLIEQTKVLTEAINLKRDEINQEFTKLENNIQNSKTNCDEMTVLLNQRREEILTNLGNTVQQVLE